MQIEERAIAVPFPPDKQGHEHHPQNNGNNAGDTGDYRTTDNKEKDHEPEQDTSAPVWFSGPGQSTLSGNSEPDEGCYDESYRDNEQKYSPPADIEDKKSASEKPEKEPQCHRHDIKTNRLSTLLRGKNET